MKKLILQFLLGREAAQVALVIARVARYPSALKTILPAIEAVESGIAAIEVVEKTHGRAQAREQVEKVFPQ